MPRSLEEIIALSEAMADDLETDDTAPTSNRGEAALRAAARRRLTAEAELSDAVVEAREAGLSWQAIGEAVGTSRQSAQKRYQSVVRRSVSA